jgi:DNA processing protein
VIACDDCLREAVLRNEALGYAEKSFTSTIQASELLRLPVDQMLARLERLEPGLVVRIDARIEEFLAAADGAPSAWAVCQHADEYPPAVAQLDDHPAVLFGAGREDRFAELTGTEAVAIVGARRASSYGREVAYGLANELSAIGLTVVSGMALGIDGAAHRGALQGGGRTVAVLAGGPDTPYPPSHRQLFGQILEVGCVVSESPPGTRAKRWAFPARNRIIAALSAITVFVEGTETSGARHTVDFADQLSTEIGAVPGPVTSPLSAGPNQFLFEGKAGLIRNTADVLDALKLNHSQRRLPEIADVEHAGLKGDVLECVASGDDTPRAIAQRLPLHTLREIVRTLGELELLGELVRDASGGYRRPRSRA